jgi:hypothetical protein
MGILNIISFIIFNSFFFDLLSYYLPVVGVGVVGFIPVYQAGGVKTTFDVPHELPTLVILVPLAWIPVPV